MINENKFMQYGFPRKNDIKCIVIHNTGVDLSLNEIVEYLNKGNSSRGCHYLINDEEIFEVMPLDYSVYHTGKGIDYACKYGIAIEICSNIDNDKYLKGQYKAIELIKKLMKEYHLNKSDIFFHSDLRM